MKTLNIKLSNYGVNLGARPLGALIIAELMDDIVKSDKVVLDFTDVKQMTLSFGTEVFDSLFSINKNFETINENKFVKDVADFCKVNIKKKVLEYA